MRHNCSVLFQLKFYILSTKGAYKSTNLVKFHMSSWTSEFCTVMGSLCAHDMKFQLKKYKELSLIKLKSNATFKEKLTFGFRHDMKNFVNFHPTTHKSENAFSMGSFCPKYTRFQLWKYGGVMFHDTEKWCKIWINHDLVVSKAAWGIGWTFIRALKSLKNCTSMGSFCPKHIMFQLENFIESMFHHTEEWCKI